MITEAQELYLRMLELTSVNNLDGPRVARDLRDNGRVWRSVLFVRVGVRLSGSGKVELYQTPMDLLSLRDLHQGELQSDTLLVLSQPGCQGDVETLAAGWAADEVHWIGIEEARRILGGRRAAADFDGDPTRVILYVWWD